MQCGGGGEGRPADSVLIQTYQAQDNPHESTSRSGPLTQTKSRSFDVGDDVSFFCRPRQLF